MFLNVKSKTDLGGLFNRRFLASVSLLFIVTIVFSPFILEANGYLKPSDVMVETEVELVNAISLAPSDRAYLIGISNDIVLEKPLEIPDGKVILLMWYSYYGNRVCLVGADGMDTIIVKSGGQLSLVNVNVTHVEGAKGRGVYVERDGRCDIFGAVISGNTADKGGGVYNEGAFYLGPEDHGEGGSIYNNSATFGGGIYNEGVFEMDSTSYICYNVATKSGGGVYNVGTFNNQYNGQIYGNTAMSGEGDDVFFKTKNSWQFYLLPIGVVIIVVVVIGLLFYRSRRRKQLVVQGLVGSVSNVGCCLCSVKDGVFR